MLEKKGSGLWKWLMALLILCNVALIATIWLKPAATPPHGRPPVNFKEQFNFTKEQDEKFQVMTKENRQKIDSLKKLANDGRQRYYATLKDPSVSAAQHDSLAAILGNYHKLIELQTYSHFSAVRAMLTESQKATFDNVIQDVLKNLPEQPHFKGDGIGPRGPRGDGAPPDGNRPPPPPGEGPPPDGPPQGN